MKSYQHQFDEVWYIFTFQFHRVASLVTQMVKNLPAMQETQVPSLGQEDPLEKGTANHSSILSRRILWTERSLAGYSSWDHKESRYD